MFNPRPYVAIDTEFSGVEKKEKAELFEVAMIYDDLKSPVEKLPYLWALVGRKTDRGYQALTYAEPYALLINFKNGIFQDIIDNKPKSVEHAGTIFHMNILNPVDVVAAINSFSMNARAETEKAVPNLKEIQLAGKNVETDIAVLKGHIERHCPTLPLFNNVFGHRSMDPGKMAAPMFGYTPGSDELNKIYDFGVQPHRAFFDAMNVVKTIRKQFNINL
jgi:hypothetical protein